MAVLEACYDDGLWLVMDNLDAGKLGENMTSEHGSWQILELTWETLYCLKMNQEHGKESKITLTTYRHCTPDPCSHACLGTWFGDVSPRHKTRQ